MFDSRQDCGQVPQRFAMQWRRVDLSLTVVEMMRVVLRALRMVRGVVPTKQRVTVAEQLVCITSVVRVVVEPYLKGRDRRDCGPYGDAKRIAAIDCQAGDLGTMGNGRVS